MVMNNRPLTYMEDEIDQPVLTPNSFLPGGARLPVKLEPHQIEEKTLKREAKRVKAAREAVWLRWKREYLAALREAHKESNTVQTQVPKEGEIVIVGEDTRNRNCWKPAKVIVFLTSRDGKIRGVKLQTAKGEMERPVQALYSLEVCATPGNHGPSQLNPEAEDFRPKRKAAEVAAAGIAATAEYEETEF